MTVIRMSVATVTASLAAEISLCAVIVYNHHLGWRKWRYNHSIKLAPGVLDLELVSGFLTGGTMAGIYTSIPVYWYIYLPLYLQFWSVGQWISNWRYNCRYIYQYASIYTSSGVLDLELVNQFLTGSTSSLEVQMKV